MATKPRPEASEAIEAIRAKRAKFTDPFRKRLIVPAKDVDTLLAELDVLRQQLAEAQRAVKNADARFQTEHQQRKDCQATLAEAEAERERLKAERDAQIQINLASNAEWTAMRHHTVALTTALSALVEEIQDEAKDLRHDAASWREASDSTGGHAAVVLMRDALANEARAQALEERADKLQQQIEHRTLVLGSKEKALTEVEAAYQEAGERAIQFDRLYQEAEAERERLKSKYEALTTALSALEQERRQHAAKQREWAESGVVFNPIMLKAQADTNDEVADDLAALLAAHPEK